MLEIYQNLTLLSSIYTRDGTQTENFQ